MKTYRALMAEIARLQRQADLARAKELKGVIKHIRELIDKHGLTTRDLGLQASTGERASAAPGTFQALLAAPARGRKAAKRGRMASASKGVARYRDPATGKTWTGRGKPPAWIAGAKDRSAFEIGAVGEPGAAPQAAKAAKAAKPKRAAKTIKKTRAVKAAKAAKTVKPVKAEKATRKTRVAQANAKAKRPAKKAAQAKSLPQAPRKKAVAVKARSAKAAKQPKVAAVPADSSASTPATAPAA